MPASEQCPCIMLRLRQITHNTCTHELHHQPHITYVHSAQQLQCIADEHVTHLALCTRVLPMIKETQALNKFEPPAHIMLAYIIGIHNFTYHVMLSLHVYTTTIERTHIHTCFHIQNITSIAHVQHRTTAHYIALC